MLIKVRPKKKFYLPSIAPFYGSAAGSPYVGPGDIVASAVAWYGLRAYSAAAAGGNAVRLIRASDSAQQDFVTLANGSLDTASIATFLAATTGKVVTLYDQTGNGHHATQGTDANRPAYTTAVLSGLPTVQFANASATTLTSNNITQAQPFTFSMVANRTNNAGGYSSMGGLFMDGNASTNIIMNAGTTLVGTTTTNAFHAIQALFDGSSSQFYIDGAVTPASPANVGTSGLSGQSITLGTDTFTALSGYIAEYGLWGSAFTGGNSALNSNQRTHWVF